MKHAAGDPVSSSFLAETVDGKKNPVLIQELITHVLHYLKGTPLPQRYNMKSESTNVVWRRKFFCVIIAACGCEVVHIY